MTSHNLAKYDQFLPKNKISNPTVSFICTSQSSHFFSGFENDVELILILAQLKGS